MSRNLRALLAAALPLALVGSGSAVGEAGIGGMASGTADHPRGPVAAVARRAQGAAGHRTAYRPAAPTRQTRQRPGRHPFYWTRGVYSSGGRGFYGWRRRASWATDFPKSDLQFVTVLQRLVRLDVYQRENAVALDDPWLRHFPVVYMVEVGYMDLTDSEVEGLRGFLEAGGFLIIDDFWGAREWGVFERNMRRVLPEASIVELPLDHPVFSTYYEIDEIKQVPAIGRGVPGGPPAAQCRGCGPAVFGIFDDDDRLMVVVNWNTDMGDAWEWAEDPRYPLEYSTYAYQMAANMIVYAMSH